MGCIDGGKVGFCEDGDGVGENDFEGVKVSRVQSRILNECTSLSPFVAIRVRPLS